MRTKPKLERWFRTTETTTKAFGGKAKDLDALRAAVVDAASVGAGLWFSYLFVLLYLVVAVGGVTHSDLLFESPVKLPFISVDLSLKGFFVLGPALFLIVHAYVLLHLVLLAGKVGAFHAELQAQISGEDARARLLRQLPSNIFVQLLAGPQEARAVRFMLWLIAQISLVILPLALLVLFQVQFLPYHDPAISWLQRLYIVADLLLVWMLWLRVARSETRLVRWRNLRCRHLVSWALVSLLPIFLVFFVATFPGEWLDENPVGSAQVVPVNFVPLEWTSLHELLFAGAVDFIARKPRSLWFNRLVLPDIDVIDHAKLDTETKIAALPHTISLRGRRLEGAVLLAARLRKADFTGADLRGADIRGGADLREANFGCGDTGAGTRCADLRGANLLSAQLQGADLDGAQLQGASLEDAELQGADLGGAQLQGASLNHAQLQGASLDYARLDGASLVGAHLQGATFDRAELQGASLDKAELQGASLGDARLQDVSLSHVFAWRADIEAT